MANWGTVPGQVGDRLPDATTVDSLPFLERPFVGKDVCLSAKPVRIATFVTRLHPAGHQNRWPSLFIGATKSWITSC